MYYFCRLLPSRHVVASLWLRHIVQSAYVLSLLSQWIFAVFYCGMWHAKLFIFITARLRLEPSVECRWRALHQSWQLLLLVSELSDIGGDQLPLRAHSNFWLNCCKLFSSHRLVILDTSAEVAYLRCLLTRCVVKWSRVGFHGNWLSNLSASSEKPLAVLTLDNVAGTKRENKFVWMIFPRFRNIYMSIYFRKKSNSHP